MLYFYFLKYFHVFKTFINNNKILLLAFLSPQKYMIKNIMKNGYYVNCGFIEAVFLNHSCKFNFQKILSLLFFMNLF